jgi:hypothetical protein
MTARRSVLGLRRPLSSAVDKPYVDNGVSSTGPMLITARRKTPKPVVSREEFAPVFTLVVAEGIDLGWHLII